jgi:hypothetical protein
VLTSFLYKAITRFAQFVILRFRADVDKEVEILVLRRMADLEAGRNRPSTPPHRAHLDPVPIRASKNHAGLRLLHGRHGLSSIGGCERSWRGCSDASLGS